MWTAAVLEERQRARQQQAATPGAAVDALISGTPNSAPLSTASTALPLRRDAIVRINRWLSAKAASDGLESFDAVPEQATAGQLATHAGLSMPLLDAVGASLPQLLGSGLGLATLKAWQLDALYLVGHPRAAPQLVNTYGRPAVAHAMLQTNMDAAVLAGTSAATTLGLSTRQLLQAVARGSGAGDVRVEATTILDQERMRHACLLAEQQRATGAAPTMRAEQAMLNGVTVTELANCGLDAQLLTSRYGLTLDELGRALGVRALCQMARIGVVIVS